ncbi:hypothetical protein CORC01_02859 [Colletotrichum orchidophilum]|uniref:Uncharacterized protein n=1 Tax=Colletotrichum orchidophilum TaxID=1209926 RepID=A0A1G4BKJ8_9PEZI|nr:uncharacterized protein CORC01_02859 [Colletotrichum orchidophilum]OHF01981.1 hypothetical protein CORC01_02859 [Colletotrichum orchidophilum]
MRAFAVAAALFIAGAQASPTLDSRDVQYGCYFKGKILTKDYYVGVGSDIDIRDTKGVKRHIHCQTTSEQIVRNVFAKCTVDNEEPIGISADANDKYAIDCPVLERAKH